MCTRLTGYVTVGIVLSLVFEAGRFFGKVSPLEFLFGLEWSPQMAIRADQVGSTGAFGALPLFAGTFLIMIIAMIVGWAVGEYPLPQIEWGITQPDFGLMMNYLVFNVGMPSLDMFLLAIPTAIIAYVIAFGDILVGFTLCKRVDHLRQDEKIELDVTRVHMVTALRNGLHALLAPWPGLAGPLWTAAHATVAERYALGRKSMDSIYSGGGTFWITGFIALFILPLPLAAFVAGPHHHCGREVHEQAGRDGSSTVARCHRKG